MIRIYKKWQGWYSKSKEHSVPEDIFKVREGTHFPTGCKESHALRRRMDQNTPETPVLANIF